MKLVRQTFVITGVSQLLMANPEFTLPANDGDSDMPNKSKLGSKTKQEQADLLVYRLPSGQLYGPAAGFRNGILLACVGRKINKMTANKVIAASVFNVEDKCPLFNPETGEPITTYTIDTRRVVNHNTNPPSAFMAHRPCVPLPWATEVVFEIDMDWYTDKGKVDLGVVVKLFETAGCMAGWMAFRPEKKGWFGRYMPRLKVEPHTTDEYEEVVRGKVRRHTTNRVAGKM